MRKPTHANDTFGFVKMLQKVGFTSFYQEYQVENLIFFG